MTEARTLAALRKLVGPLLLLAALLCAPGVQAQVGSDRIAAALFADGPPQPGKTWTLALRFTPREPGWHGYWANPGDAGQPMRLAWSLPHGWRAGAPQYPLPEKLVVAGLMNHVYEHAYTVLVPVAVPQGAAAANLAPIGLSLDYLACTDTICVPQHADLSFDPAVAVTPAGFARWRAAIVPDLDRTGGFEFAGERLRIAIPYPAAAGLDDPHVFLETDDLGGGLRPRYAEVQTFIAEGNLLVAEIPLKRAPGAAGGPPATAVAGILATGAGRGLRFTATPADVPLEGAKPLARKGERELPVWLILLGAVAGGLLLNVMPCVFPILSLKALALAKAGGDERGARGDALAYTAGVVLACTALGAAILALRSAGEQVGWAFQLQEPRVVVALLLLALAITANFAGLFAVPGMALAGGAPSRSGSFATGLLAAFVATPCTGPFMALALGAALVLPPVQALLVFAALGAGLALPFLLVGFVPALRRRLPKPGPWMERFRRWMAVPMALTAAALVWLLSRLGGAPYAALAIGLGAAMLAGLWWLGRQQRGGKRSGLAIAMLALASLAAIAALPAPRSPVAEAQASLLSPRPFSEAALAEARASGQPVFLWFTADWCLTCKVNEGIAIEREETRKAFAEAGVIAMRGDWTAPDPEIAAFLARQGAAGVPLYLWYPAGGEARTLPQVLSPQSLPDLAREAARR